MCRVAWYELLNVRQGLLLLHPQLGVGFWAVSQPVRKSVLTCMRKITQKCILFWPYTPRHALYTSVAMVRPAVSQLPKLWLVPDLTGLTVAYLDWSLDFDLVVISGWLKSIFFFFLFLNLIFIHSMCREHV